MISGVTTRLRIDPALPATLAQQLREQLTWLICSGDVPVGTRLPSVRDLAGELGINLHTVRSAYGKLEADGLVETRQGRGTRVAAFDPRRLWPPEAAARTHVAGVVVPALANPFYVALVSGVEEVARASGTLLIVSTTGDDQAVALRSVAQLSAKGVDGLIVVSHDVSHLLVTAHGGGEGPWMPLVVVDRPGIAGNTVEANLEAAGFEATRHLVEHGHRAIGLITVGEGLSNTAPLEAGYRRSLGEAGLDPHDRLVARVGAFDMAAGAEGAARLLAGDGRPTAIVAIDDLLAIGALRAARAAGLRVPDDVAIVGVDDIPFAGAVDPPLTTVALPAAEMGREAMRTLDLLLAGMAGEPRKVMLETNLVIRESCGRHASP
jgi:LacI family transcriptional regulator, repressor for deo operon, udp, cdd, tsx, nupC, and nupG